MAVTNDSTHEFLLTSTTLKEFITVSMDILHVHNQPSSSLVARFAQIAVKFIVLHGCQKFPCKVMSQVLALGFMQIHHSHTKNLLVANGAKVRLKVLPIIRLY